MPLAGAIVLPDGALVRGRGRREPFPDGPLPEFGLYLGRPGHRDPWRPTWEACWLDWPDFRTPRDRGEAVRRIVELHRRALDGERVEVTCVGGTGRTGTVIACLAVRAGVPAADAVAWTRAHYRRRAVETPGQRRWISWFAQEVAG